MKWYLMAFTERVQENLHIHVPGLDEWLMSQYDQSKHKWEMGLVRTRVVFQTFAEHWWAQGHGKDGSRQPLQIEREPSSKIHAGKINLLDMDISIMPEHKMTEIMVHYVPVENRFHWTTEPLGGASENEHWRRIYAMLQCDRFSDVQGNKLLDFYGECRERIQTENTMRVKEKTNQLHQWYDDLRDYVRREHGKEMPPALGRV